MKEKRNDRLRSNTKLGRNVFGWSIPAILTCPGASDLCKSICYACKHRYHSRSVKDSLATNYAISKKPGFVERTIEEIQRRHIKTVRIHVAGDFYSAEYARKWLKIIHRLPGVTFTAYTRSWRVKEIDKVLKTMGRAPNMHLWFSADRETGKPPVRKGVRVAWMAVDDNDLPPAWAHLAFRDDRGEPMKWMNNKLVCPAENGVQTKVKMTCDACRVCYRNKPVKQRQENGRGTSLPVLSGPVTKNRQSSTRPKKITGTHKKRARSPKAESVG